MKRWGETPSSPNLFKPTVEMNSGILEPRDPVSLAPFGGEGWGEGVFRVRYHSVHSGNSAFE